MTRVTSQWTTPVEFNITGVQWAYIETAAISGSLAQANDALGTSVDVSADGKTVVVGGPFYGSDPVNGDPGGVVVAVKGSDNAWNRVANLIEDTGTPSYNMGRSVAISGDGNTILVGSNSYLSSGNGAIRFFTRTDPLSSLWEPIELFQSDEGIGSQYGTSVTISKDGNYAATATFSGQLYIYKKTGSIWELAQKINDAAILNNPGYGTSISMSGDGTYLVVGAPLQTAPGAAPGLHNGCLFLYKKTGTTWARVIELYDEITQELQLGVSVAISDDGYVVLGGAVGYLSNPTDSYVCRGAGLFFTRNIDTWIRSTTIVPPPTLAVTDMGRAVALTSTGDVAFIGAPLYSEDVPSKGRVYVYAKSAGTWSYVAEYDRDTGNPERFGTALAASANGMCVVVGSPGAVDSSISSGVGYIYE